MILKDAIKHLEQELNDKQDWSCVACKEDHEQLLEWLKELQAIKKADDNEALEKLDSMYYLCTPQRYYDPLDNCYNTIKNYILKAQEQERVLKIIFEKRIDMWHLFDLLDQTYEMYLVFCASEKYASDYILTQEEFELIGKVIDVNDKIRGVTSEEIIENFAKAKKILQESGTEFSTVIIDSYDNIKKR